jgi:hypothetical protein
MVAENNKTEPNTNWDLVTTAGLVPTDGFSGSRWIITYSAGHEYEDDPSLAGSGTRAFSIYAGPNLCISRSPIFSSVGLRLLQYRCEVGAGVGESMLIRFWRYRRQLNGTGYQITQATDSVTANDTNTPFAIDQHFESATRDLVFNLETDALAMTYVYTIGTGSIKAWRINWDFTPVDPEGIPIFPSDPVTWPPV